MAATRARILDAVVALHAERGTVATTYAMIAERADVAIPTVYKYFPALADLLPACIGHVADRLPGLGPHIFAGAEDTTVRLRALTRAVFAHHRALQPWLRWTIHEAEVLPELGVQYRRLKTERAALIAEALAPAFGHRPPAALVGLIDTMLDFSSWQTLTDDHRMSDREAAATVGDALVALLDLHRPAAMPDRAARPLSTRRT
ncbi:MAG: TetR/AcrR family transcriptional regulator [Rhodospirillales bacterium]|nr:TetR/AcrR family transcriptional regulator [Rhodospirillales bacterium]